MRLWWLGGGFVGGRFQSPVAFVGEADAAEVPSSGGFAAVVMSGTGIRIRVAAGAASEVDPLFDADRNAALVGSMHIASKTSKSPYFSRYACGTERAPAKVQEVCP